MKPLPPEPKRKVKNKMGMSDIDIEIKNSPALSYMLHEINNLRGGRSFPPEKHTRVIGKGEKTDKERLMDDLTVSRIMIERLEKRFEEYVQQHDIEFVEFHQDVSTRIKKLEEEFERMDNERKVLNHRFTKLEEQMKDTIRISPKGREEALEKIKELKERMNRSS